MMLSNTVTDPSDPVGRQESRFFCASYWKRRLHGADPRTAIPTDYDRGLAGNGELARIEVPLSDFATEAICKIAGAQDLSAYIVLLASVNVLLRTYCGREDLVVASPSYRSAAMNSWIPLCGRVAEGLSFRDMLRASRECVLEAYARQEIIFSDLISRPNVMVSFEGLHACIDESGTELHVSFRREKRRFGAVLSFRADLFRIETVSEIGRHYTHLLDKLLGNIRCPLAEIPRVSSGEERVLLETFNSRAELYPLDKPLHVLFEEQVQKTPQRIAASADGIKITYQELNGRANQTAHLLRRIHPCRNQFVGVFMHRGIDFLVAILGALKAGGAYIPIEPNYPKSRICHMIADSRIRTLLTHGGHIPLPFDETGLGELRNIICLDSAPAARISSRSHSHYDISDLMNEPTTDPVCINESQDLAYMIYTSGTTGLPKGAMVRHDSAVNHIFAQFGQLRFHEDTRFLQSAPSSSDIAVWQFLSPLLIGGRTVVVTFETICDACGLFDFIRREKITVFELVPAVLKELLNVAAKLEGDQRMLPALEHGIVTGESVPVAMVNHWFECFPGVRLVNAYGPTEAADDICQFIMDRPLPAQVRSVPIGRPLGNLSIYVLDSGLKLTPVGAPGEICVAGVGVGNGYWGDEGKTRKSFVPNPYAEKGHGKVLYRTGDLGRWLPEGNLEFLGRLDDQVKIRGYRIELAEIETVLDHFPGISRSVVVVCENRMAEKYLAAYCIRSDGFEMGADELRDYASKHLPEWMVPSAFVFVSKLPSLPNGKVDRRALPPPEAHMEQARKVILPRTQSEKHMVDIWQEVLRTQPIGIYSNFFELGGHSLLATQLLSRIREAFGVEVPLKSLFQAPTVAAIVEIIEWNRMRLNPDEISADHCDEGVI